MQLKVKAGCYTLLHYNCSPHCPPGPPALALPHTHILKFKHLTQFTPTLPRPLLFLQEKTKEAIDEDGWLHTGDIGLWTEEWALKIIDRKKNIYSSSARFGNIAVGDYAVVGGSDFEK